MSKNQLTISSNTLFHFTNKINNIISILRDGFRPHCCIEDFNLIYSYENDESLEHAFPMVCFCDLPLSLVKNHMKNYGYYGIGLSKEWGVRNNISPVLYAHDASAITLGIAKIAGEIFSHDQDLKEAIYTDIFRVFSFTKPYKGKLWRSGKYSEDIRFYDEREWRFVPIEEKFRYGISKKSFLDETIRDEFHKELWEKVVLQFKPSDIKYIIVSRENQITTVIKKIERIKRYSQDEIKLLCSRVISAEQICEDF